MEQKIKSGSPIRENYMDAYFTPPTTLCLNIGNFTCSPAARNLNELLSGFAACLNFTGFHIAYHVSGKFPSTIFTSSNTVCAANDENVADDHKR